MFRRKKVWLSPKTNRGYRADLSRIEGRCQGFIIYKFITKSPAQSVAEAPSLVELEAYVLAVAVLTGLVFALEPVRAHGHGEASVRLKPAFAFHLYESRS